MIKLELFFTKTNKIYSFQQALLWGDMSFTAAAMNLFSPSIQIKQYFLYIFLISTDDKAKAGRRKR
jgi:hypothetical protein